MLLQPSGSQEDPPPSPATAPRRSPPGRRASLLALADIAPDGSHARSAPHNSASALQIPPPLHPAFAPPAPRTAHGCNSPTHTPPPSGSTPPTTADAPWPAGSSAPAPVYSEPAPAPPPSSPARAPYIRIHAPHLSLISPGPSAEIPRRSRPHSVPAGSSSAPRCPAFRVPESLRRLPGLPPYAGNSAMR